MGSPECGPSQPFGQATDDAVLEKMENQGSSVDSAEGAPHPASVRDNSVTCLWFSRIPSKGWFKALPGHSENRPTASHFPE